MKRLVILRHNSGKGGKGELANQLWNFMSIYAYALERGWPLENHSFFEYQHQFSFPPPQGIIGTLFFNPFPTLERAFGHTRTTIWWRRFYKLYVMVIKTLQERAVLYSHNSPDIDGIFYLPPSPEVKPRLTALETDTYLKTIYFDGWLFRNPDGIKKYHSQIKDYFRPRQETLDNVNTFMAPLREHYGHVVGIHIRQGDYKTFKNGKYFVEQTRIREILDEYLAQTGNDPRRTCFVITSNGPIEKERFVSLTISVSDRSFIEDLFLLASCDVIIGSDSSFGNFAAYYADVPHIIFKTEPIDWEYYRHKDRYFLNKYCTLVNF